MSSAPQSTAASRSRLSISGSSIPAGGFGCWLKADAGRARAPAETCRSWKEMLAPSQVRQRPTALLQPRQKTAAIRETGKRVAALFHSRQDDEFYERWSAIPSCDS